MAGAETRAASESDGTAATGADWRAGIKGEWDPEPPQLAAARRNSAAETVEQLDLALQNLCQPLTVLRCELELAGVVGTEERFRSALHRALVECVRLTHAVDGMRELLQTTMMAHN